MPCLLLGLQRSLTSLPQPALPIIKDVSRSVPDRDVRILHQALGSRAEDVFLHVAELPVGLILAGLIHRHRLDGGTGFGLGLLCY